MFKHDQLKGISTLDQNRLNRLGSWKPLEIRAENEQSSQPVEIIEDHQLCQGWGRRFEPGFSLHFFNDFNHFIFSNQLRANTGRVKRPVFGVKLRAKYGQIYAGYDQIVGLGWVELSRLSRWMNLWLWGPCCLIPIPVIPICLASWTRTIASLPETKMSQACPKVWGPVLPVFLETISL